jgi:iron complex outermembrane receptor protein
MVFVSFTQRLLLATAATVVIPSALFAAAPDAPPSTASTAAATSPADADTGAIVVTARRRAETLKDVPIAVTAITGAQLAKSGAIDITDVAQSAPNVTLEVSRGTNSTLSAFIRGVGQQDPVAGFEQGVGIYLDDVYLNRPQGAVMDIYDVERIEVLRGPQGTLYGRNTIGGAVKYVTRRLSSCASAAMSVTMASSMRPRPCPTRWPMRCGSAPRSPGFIAAGSGRMSRPARIITTRTLLPDGCRPRSGATTMR